MHLYSNNVSTIATISSLIMSELFPGCFYCRNNFILSPSSLGSDDKNLVFENHFSETPEGETIILCDLSNLLSV